MRWAGLTRYLGDYGWKSWVVTAAPPARTSGENPIVVSCPRRRTLNDAYRALRSRHAGSDATTGDDASPVPSSGGGGTWDRLRLEAGALLSIPDAARGWILRAASRARRLIAEVKPDTVVSTGPPHSAHVAGWLATRATRVPWLADLRDPWAGPNTSAWQAWPEHRSTIWQHSLELLERLVFAGAAGVVCNTKEFRAALEDAYRGIAVHWVPNGVDRALLPPRSSDRFPGLSVAYVGTLYGGRTMSPVLRALRAILDRGGDNGPHGLTLRVAGSIGPEALATLRQDIEALALQDHVEMLGALTRADALSLSGRSSIAIVLAQGQQLQVPAKLYELVAMGIPTVAIAELGSATHQEARRVGAMAVSPDDPLALSDMMVSALRGNAPRPDAELVDYGHLARDMHTLLAGLERERGTAA
ncbi:MAG TPA: glycosyltransferase [Solirubrobacteraceae bacterium]|nr:glycosyltransferase [Solirubrobacteraceae bacterium]